MILLHHVVVKQNPCHGLANFRLFSSIEELLDLSVIGARSRTLETARVPATQGRPEWMPGLTWIRSLIMRAPETADHLMLRIACNRLAILAESWCPA